MDENSKKEEFSYGYIHTLASVCGYITHRAQRAEDNFLGIDLEIINSQHLENGQAPRIFAQAKCTTLKYFYKEKDHFKYDLEVRNYNQLIKKSIDPSILILVIVPENTKDWMNIYEDKQESLIKGCAYWLSLENMEQTVNIHTVRIKIPKENILTPIVLQRIMKDSTEYREKLFSLREEIDEAEGDGTN